MRAVDDEGGELIVTFTAQPGRRFPAISGPGLRLGAVENHLDRLADLIMIDVVQINPPPLRLPQKGAKQKTHDRESRQQGHHTTASNSQQGQCTAPREFLVPGLRDLFPVAI